MTDRPIVVYVEHTRERDGALFLVPIGVGVRRPNGDLELTLDAVPVSGRLIVRERQS